MSESSSQQLVVFSLGSEEHALPIAAVHASSQQIAAYAAELSQTADSLRGLVSRLRLQG